MRPFELAKRLAFGCALVVAAPFALASWLELRLTRSEQVFGFCAQLLALLPGLPGAYVRAAYYFATLERAAWETHVGFGSVFIRRAASMGRHVSMGCYCVIGNAAIEDGVMMGSRVSVPSGKRQHLGADGRPSASDGIFDRVTIGEGCWVGEGAILLADVGPRCIVSAGAVVTRALPGDLLIAGNPARIVRSWDEAPPATKPD